VSGEIPGYAAKLVEDKNFYADKTSERPVAMIHGEEHTLVPFITIEDGGCMGAHAQAFLRTLAKRVVRQGRRSRAPSRDRGGSVLRSDWATQVSLWVERWQRHILSWLHLSLLKQFLRLSRSLKAAEDIFS